jgi:hypothetical protein
MSMVMETEEQLEQLEAAWAEGEKAAERRMRSLLWGSEQPGV